MVDELDERIEACTRDLRTLGADHPSIPLLMTVPGVGWVLALHIIDEPMPALREACRVLKPGGRFVLITQAKAPIEGPLWAPIRSRMTLYTDAELRALLTDAGFADVEACPTSDMGQLGYGVKA